MIEKRRPIAVLADREGLGDVLLKRPFLKAVRAAYPEHDVWWIVTHQTSMDAELRVLVGCDVARIIPHAGLDGPLPALARRLRELPPFERVFDSRTKVITVAACRSFMRHRGYYCCLPGFILCDGRAPPGRRRPTHVGARMNALFACATGAPPPNPPPLTSSTEAERQARAMLAYGQVYVGIAPGSRVEGTGAAAQRSLKKRWPMERFVELARALMDRQLTPVFFLGPSEDVSAAAILAAAPGSMVIAAGPGPARAGLDLLVAQGGRLAALVANDNGVGHVMGAVGAPVVSLFGPTDPLRWAPIATANLVLWSRDFDGSDNVEAIPTPAVTAAVLAAVGRGGLPLNARIGSGGVLSSRGSAPHGGACLIAR